MPIGTDISSILAIFSALLLTGCDRQLQPEDCIDQFSGQFPGEGMTATRKVAATFGFQMTDGLQDWMLEGIDGVRPSGTLLIDGNRAQAEDAFAEEMVVKNRPRAIMLLSDPAHYVHAPKPFTSRRAALRSLGRFCNMTDRGLRLRSVTTSYQSLPQDQ